MLTNYLKIAYRNLFKNKVFSLINLFGLAVGTAAFVLIFQYVSFQLSYDATLNSHIYRVQVDQYRNNELESKNAFTVPALGPTIAAEIPGIEDYFRLTSWAESHTVIYRKSERTSPVTFKEEKTIFADPAFVRYFSLHLITAMSDSLLAEPNQVIISASTAKRYFGENWQTMMDPLEKTLLVYNSNDHMEIPFIVAGVFEDMPQNSHLQYDLIFSHKTLPNFLPKEIPEEQRLTLFETMWGPNAWYTYLLLNDQVSPQEVAQKITDFSAQRNQNESTKEVYNLQPVKDIHLHSNLMNEASAGGNPTLVYVMMIIASFILVIGWINYINLSTARAVDRAREVGVRKIIGARRWQLMGQFLLEVSILNGIALIIAVTLVQLFTPVFNNITGIRFSFFSEEITNLWWVIGGVYFLGTLGTGLYPALLLASFRPATVLKGKLSAQGKGIYLRKSLVVFQFGISLVLIIGTAVIYGQIQFMKNQDLGFDTARTMVIEGPNVLEEGADFSQTVAILKNELTGNASIEKVTASSHVPGNPDVLYRSVSRIGRDELGTKEIKEINVEADYLPTLNIDLIAGRNFSDVAEQNRQKVLLNEAALPVLGFTSANEAVGAKIGTQNAMGVMEYEVIGVTENFHQNGLQSDFEPICFFYELYSGSYLVKIASAQQASVGATLAFIQQKWKKVLPNNPFNYYFLDGYFNRQYRADQQFGSLFGIFALLAILIACLGLFGLSSYLTTQRTKEIGIRKILGASVQNIVTLLSQDFIKLVLIASVLALPLAYWVMEQWLADYAFRINISWWLLLMPVLLVFLLAIITVSVQTMKTALINPGKSLRYE